MTGPSALALAAALLLGAGGAAPPSPSPALPRDEQVVRSLFPDADAVEARDVVLTDEMAARVEQLARARVKERLVTFYVARAAGAVKGYAVIHSHVVRTKRETFAIAFEPDGTIRKITVLSFLEPDEYRPPERWLAQLEGKGPKDRIVPGQDIPPITGATLTARGIAEASRWLLQALREAVPEARR